MISAEENEEMELHQSLIDHEGDTNEQGKEEDIEKSKQEQEKVAEKNQEEQEKSKDKEVSNDFPGVKLISKKRNAQSPIEEKMGKGTEWECCSFPLLQRI